MSGPTHYALDNMATLRPRFTPSQDTPYCHASNIGQIMGITGTFTAAALITVLLRVYVRVSMLSIFGADDWVMLAACLMAIGTLVCFVGEINYGVGRHAECILLPELEMMMKWQFYHNLWVMFGVVFVKISVAFFLMRLASKKAWKWFLGGCVVFLTCFALACAGTLIFSCIPIAASWNLALAAKPSTKCFTPHTFSSIGLFNSIVNIATDFLFALLPIPIIWHLQINLRTKITLAMILSLGFVACAAGIVKAHLQTTFLANEDRYWDDGFMVWNMIELCLGIMAGSLPALKPLFKAFLQGTRTALGLSGERSKDSNRTPGGGSAGSKGYRRQRSTSRVAEGQVFEERGVEFTEMKRMGTAATSVYGKDDVEAEREGDLDVDTVPIRGKDAGAWDGTWR